MYKRQGAYSPWCPKKLIFDNRKDFSIKKVTITPYIEHPKAVASRVKTDDEKAVAFGHDILEDCNWITPLYLLDNGLEPHIVEAIKILTKTNNKSYSDYLYDVKDNPLARTVKIADLLSNLADNPTNKQIRKYAVGLQVLVDCDFN